MSNITEIGIFKSLELLKQVKHNNLSVLVDLGNENELTCIKLGAKKVLLPSTFELLNGFYSRDQKTIIKTPIAQHYTSQA